MEHVGLVVRMFHFETIASRFDILIRGDLVTRNVDIPFDLSLLESKSASTEELTREVGPNRVFTASHPV